MTLISRRRKRVKLATRTRTVLYILNFLFALHIAIVTYYTSSFLMQVGIPESLVGIVYAAGSFSGAISLFWAPKLLKHFGNYRLLIILAIVSALVFAIHGLTLNIYILAIPFILSFAVPYMIGFSLDIFLENNTIGEKNTGGIRATFITMANVAFVVAPTVGGWLIVGNNFSLLYITSGIIMVPFTLLAFMRLMQNKKIKYKMPSIRGIRYTMKRSRNMRNIFASNFLLRIFYAVMVVYAPIYLNNHIGLSFTQIGILSSIALLAFVLLEIPLAHIADSKFGEKEMLAGGFAVLAFSTITIAFVSTPSLLIWGSLLFITRIGAAMVDIMSESYFFKHISGEDTDDVSAFRTLSPIAYTIGPIFAATVLMITSLSMLFVITGMILLSGIWFALQIKDTR